MDTENLTQLGFDQEDLDKARYIAEELGYEQHAYTSSSALWGLYCIPSGDKVGPDVQGCIIKTKELGFLFVQTLEDLQLKDEEGNELR